MFSLIPSLVLYLILWFAIVLNRVSASFDIKKRIRKFSRSQSQKKRAGRAIMAAKKVSSWRLIIVAALVLLGLLLLAGLREADAADPCAIDSLFQTFCDDEPSPKDGA
jgi:hypothetical protein